LQIGNLEKSIFVKKNRTNNPKFGTCNTQKTMEEVFELKTNLVEELEEEFASAYEHEKVSCLHEQ
jgi:hypothetical protein